MMKCVLCVLADDMANNNVSSCALKPQQAFLVSPATASSAKRPPPTRPAWLACLLGGPFQLSKQRTVRLSPSLSLSKFKCRSFDVLFWFTFWIWISHRAASLPLCPLWSCGLSAAGCSFAFVLDTRGDLRFLAKGEAIT